MSNEEYEKQLNRVSQQQSKQKALASIDAALNDLRLSESRGHIVHSLAVSAPGTGVKSNAFTFYLAQIPISALNAALIPLIEKHKSQLAEDIERI